MEFPKPTHILTVNAGSSSIKLALFEAKNELALVIECAVENIGQPITIFSVKGANKSDNQSISIAAVNHSAAVSFLASKLPEWIPNNKNLAIGHRIVHGGPHYYEPCAIDNVFLAELDELTIFDPEHVPLEKLMIEKFKQLYPNSLQIACFDTAFHHNLPNEARLLAIPRHYEAQGVRRYGFHGLSYESVMQELGHLNMPEIPNSRIIIAHLGNGVSLAAIQHGTSIDTTMALTPAAGVPMSVRSGDLDPGLALYLSRSEGMDAEAFNNMVNFKSGLYGISEITSDMKQLLELESEDSRAADAVNLFCYQIKKAIGSFAAALGGLDILVFTGGIGEQAPKIRADICQGLDFLGITIDETRNAKSEPIISPNNAAVTTRVIPANESLIIAQHVWQLVGQR